MGCSATISGGACCLANTSTLVGVSSGCVVGSSNSYTTKKNSCEKENMNVIVIKPGYDMSLVLPFELFPALQQMKLATGNDSMGKSLSYSREKMQVYVIEEDTISPQAPDPAIAKEKREEYRKKLMEELKQLEAEEDK